MSGDTIRIIASGTPLTYNKTASNADVIEDLTNNFLNTTFATTGFEEDLNTVFSNAPCH
jgi:muramoyltetrapeptide carboxypeptidase LdcA involved in peptidoglycan recycling